MTHRFPFHENKAVAALARLLKLSQRPRSKGELVKLLYLAERKMLLRRGSPITGDRLCALPHGTIASKTLNLINDLLGGEPTDLFEQHFEPGDHQSIRLIKEPEPSPLSRAETTAIDEVFAEDGSKDFNQLRARTHALPEYVDPDGSMIEVSPESILVSENRPQSEIDRLRAKAEDQMETAALFKSAEPFTSADDRALR